MNYLTYACTKEWGINAYTYTYNYLHSHTHTHTHADTSAHIPTRINA